MKPLDFGLYCLPDQAPIDTQVHAELGWSIELLDSCWVVTAQNVLGDQSSSITSISYPPDCIPLPEMSPISAGLLLLAALCRRKRAHSS